MVCATLSSPANSKKTGANSKKTGAIDRSALAYRALAGMLLGSTMLASGTAAQAQQTAQASTSNQASTILVTSQRRTENLQDVPVSIEVLGTEQLDNLQVDSFEDYVKFLPSVATQNYGGPFYQLVFMRGVASGGDGNHSGSLPSVGTYIDEQPITTAQGNLNVHLYDIARVESLAGPQGTLYGASSQAGTIRIITNKPDYSGFKAGVDGEVNLIDHGDFGGSLEGFINAPLSDRIAVRAVGWYVRDGGYIDNVRGIRTFPSSGEVDDNQALVEDNFNDSETYGGRIALGIELDENWTVTPTLMAQKQNTSGTFAQQNNLPELQAQTYRDNFQNDKWYQAALSVEGKIGSFDLVYSGAFLTREIEGLLDYSDYSYFYDSNYGSGAYFYAECAANDATCPLVNPSQYFESTDKFRKVSQEIRISSPSENRFRVSGGLFYQRQEHDIEQRYKIDGLADFIEVSGRPDHIWLTKQTRTDRDYAAFGQVEFDITQQLTITGGLRYFKYDNTLIGFFGYGAGFSGSTGEAACFGPATTVGAPCTNLGVLNASGGIDPRRSKDDGFIHRLNLTYKITPDHMVYATWSRGFRPGGTNRRGGLIGYRADFLTNYEFGWKTSWADGKLRFNGAVFQLDWSNFQFSILGPNGLTEIRNAAQARIRGVESSLILQPSNGLTIGAGMTYLDAKLTENYCGSTDAAGVPIIVCPTPLAPAGTRLPASSKFKGNLTIRYETPFGDNMLGHVQLAGVYQSSVRSNLELETNRLIGNQPGYGTVDFALGVKHENAGWTAEAYVTNLLDERGQTYRYAACGASVCATDNPANPPGITYSAVTQPRTFGLKLGYRY